MSRKPLDAATRTTLLKHVRHEWMMYMALEPQLEKLRHDDILRKRGLAVAAYEACMVHARNLIAFLFPSKTPADDDVVATDLLPSWVIGTIPQVLDDVVAVTNKQIAHLTRQRLDLPEHGQEIPWRDVHAALHPLMVAFWSDVEKTTDPRIFHSIDHSMANTVSMSPAPVFFPAAPPRKKHMP